LVFFFKYQKIKQTKKEKKKKIKRE
jgi:hypothetical protein